MATRGYLARERLDDLLAALAAAGYRCVGPRVRDGAISYEPLEAADELPVGVRDAQAPGEYRVRWSEDRRCFAWANGPQALKPWLFAPREAVWRCARGDDGRLHFEQVLHDPEPIAVIGVRACDLAALRLQDRHFIGGHYPDEAYARRRERLLMVAVNCTHPAQTCFCASTGDGPSAEGADLTLDELDDGFIVAASGEAGDAVAGRLALASVSSEQTRAAGEQHEAAIAAQRRALPSGLRGRLRANLEHPQWRDVAQRCLSCGNCTSVCPTCFCHRLDTQPSIDGSEAVRERAWDSCFTAGHSYAAGHVLREDTRLRYRQWLVHKLDTWHDQYGRSGCVGCGRCITWCPVGIDITAEAAAIAGNP